MLCNHIYAITHLTEKSMIPQIRTVFCKLSIPRVVPSSISVVAKNSFVTTSSLSSVSPSESNNQTFASLMRNSKLTSIGNPVGKVVIGKVYHVVDDDLYIDFGHKFGCVCKKPRYKVWHYNLDFILRLRLFCRDDRGKYIRGTEVKLKIKSLELSQKFLGHEKDMSLLESDCVLLGIHK